jgi:hypothetical protein
MKVRINYTTTVSDEWRMALRHQFGECGTLADRREVKDCLRLVGSNNDEDMMQEWQDCEDCQAAWAEQ